MKDQTTLAYINMYAVLGTLENLCDVDAAAKELLAGEAPVSIGFAVKNGPHAVLRFDGGKCTLSDDMKCNILLPFPSCEKFNLMVDGKYTPIPLKGYTRLNFLLKKFMPLTDRLAKIMRPTPEDLTDPAVKHENTLLMAYLIAAAVSQIANHDFIGRFSARNTEDGNVSFKISGGPAATISVRDHIFKTSKTECKSPDAVIEFDSMDTAFNVFNDLENSMACVCEGKITMLGMIGTADNVNRILDRVSYYLR